MKGHQIIGELRPELYFQKFWNFIEGSPDHWWVTTKTLPHLSSKVRLKGHQIIGELRLVDKAVSIAVEAIEGSPDHWWVTTEYQLLMILSIQLKGHQIIGELRRFNSFRKSKHNNWRVTRSLVSYDDSLTTLAKVGFIEGSPDHWWVTTKRNSLLLFKSRLKGHQIIGELRHNLFDKS